MRCWLLLLLLSVTVVLADAPVSLRLDQSPRAVGLDNPRPRFSWQPGVRQTAYQVLVRAGGAVLWDSGRVDSAETVGIPYAGPALSSRQRCSWAVRVWDAAGQPSPWSAEQTWSMGLLARGDWVARWVTASRWYTPPAYRPPGFVTAEFASPDAPAWAEVDLGRPLPLERVRLTPLAASSFPLRWRVEVDDQLDFDHPRVLADRGDRDYRLTDKSPVEVAGAGLTARYVRLVILRSPGARKFRSAVRQLEVFSGGRNVARWRPTREFGTDWNHGHATALVDGLPSADEGPVCPPDALSTAAAPLLRKPFTVAGAVRRATLYHAALGLAELTLNRQRVGDEVLAPPFTDATKRVVYLTHDVTDLVHGGENVLEATLGNGWFATPGRGFGERHNGQGPPRLLAQLELELADGTRQVLGSDETWQWRPSPITFNHVWLGYTEDRRLADTGDWRPVALAEDLGGRLTAPVGPPVKVVGAEPAVRVAGNQVHFAALSAGWPRLKLNGHAGQTVTITGADLGKLSWTLAADGPTVLEPRFVFFSGPTTLTVTGLTEPLKPEDVSLQLVRADWVDAGSFSSSSRWLNKLHDTLQRTHRNYVLDHPLDPMREKQGWTEDAQSMFETAAYLTDVAGMYRKWWLDFADNQHDDGMLGSVMPVVGRLVNDWNCPWWSGVIAMLPWMDYQQHGDPAVLAQAYEPMRRYVDYLGELARLGVGRRKLDYPDRHHDLDQQAAADGLLIWDGAADWLNPYFGLPAPMTAMPGWFACADIVAKSAALLGHAPDAAKYRRLADDLKQRYNARYFHPDTGLYGDRRDSQTAQLLPLALGMVPAGKEELTWQRLLDALHAHQDHVGVGFIGLPPLLQTLAAHNAGALGGRLVNQQTFPGWKTLMHDGVFAESWAGGGAQMPSCGGAIGLWLYQAALGIRPDLRGPGFKRSLIAPLPDPAHGLTWAKGWYDSVRGRITVDWRLVDGRFKLDVTVPPNTLATIRVPTADPAAVAVGGLKVVALEADAVTVEAGGGRWTFDAAAPLVEAAGSPPKLPPGGDFADDLSAAKPDWKAYRGDWRYAGGELVGRGLATYGLQERAWADATYTVRGRLVDNGGSAENWLGLQFRKREPGDIHDDSGYLVFLRANGQLALFRTGQTLATAATGVDPRQWVTLRVATRGPRLQVFVNDEAQARIDVTDDEFDAGYASLATCGSTAAFGGFRVK